MSSPDLASNAPPLALVTDRLLLRDVGAADVDAIVRFFGEPESRDSILVRQRDPQHVARLVGNAAQYNAHYHWRMRESFVFAACLRESGALIGYVSLLNTISQGRDARIGWHFGSAYAGRGLATEATAEALRFAFGTIGVERMLGDCNQTNAASTRIFAKIGMVPFEHGYVRNRIRALRYGQPVPVARFAIDRRTWLVRETVGSRAPE